ncbi:hypothetical protein EON65_50630, partial [archaeon]
MSQSQPLKLKISNMFANINQEALQAASRKAVVFNSQWEELLSFRIALQKSLDAANRLPSADITRLADEIPDIIAAEQLNHEQQQTIKQLQGMAGALYECLHSNEEPGHKKNKENFDGNSSREKERKRKNQMKLFDKLDADEMWEKIESVQKGLQPQWESILDQMNTRVQFGLGGQKSASNKALKVFHQAPWAQIESILTDDNRVVEKSRASAEESPRMGAAQELAPLLPLLNTAHKGGDDESGDEDEHGRAVRGRVGNMYVVQDSKGKRRLYDMEVYEDTGLYSLLLKAFISTKGSGEG